MNIPAPFLPPSVMQMPSFVRFWFAKIFSTLSFHMLSVAVGWQVYMITGSAFDLGLVGLAQFLPMIVLTFLVGHVADRYDRRLIACLCLWVEGLAALALAIGSYYNWLERNDILIIVVLGSAARAFESPTMAALIPGIVSRPMISRATAWSTSATQVAQILGPALGGFAFGLGATTVYGFAALLFFIAGGLLNRIHTTSSIPKKSPITLQSIFSGIAFIRSRPVILGTISLDLFAVLLGGATALLPIYAHDILHTGPWGLGLLRAAPAIGALSMGIWLARFPLRYPVGKTLFAALGVFGLATVVFGVSTHILLSLGALFILGMADVVSVIVRFSLVQLQTPDEMLGRVSAVNSLFIGASNQLGEFESGITAALFGTVPAVLLGGVGTIVVALLWIKLFPDLWRLRSLEGEDK